MVAVTSATDFSRDVFAALKEAALLCKAAPIPLEAIASLLLHICYFR
uniref:Uncharacterized protein n=1 Tax=Siphoviridae sp. ctL0q1 TaxID=2825449 RepID=A0A8S5PKI3_9CAUD|nr:MAG TPA: hypothetical protein [Siphoviridae sp. ctL0q1]